MLNSRARVQIPAHPKIFPRKFFPKEFLGASRESNPDHREIKKSVLNWVSIYRSYYFSHRRLKVFSNCTFGPDKCTLSLSAPFTSPRPLSFSPFLTMSETPPTSPLLAAMTRPVASGAPKKKARKVEFELPGPLEHLPQMHDALDEVEDDVEVVEEPKRKRRAPKRTEEPSKREEAPRSPVKRVRTRALPRPPASSRAQAMAAAATAEEGPRGFWLYSTDTKDQDYELKRAGKLEGFLPCTAEEWLALPNDSHTKYTRKVWQEEGRKAVYAIVGSQIDGKRGRYCNGYKSSGPAWNALVADDVQYYKSDGHKRTKSAYKPR